MRACCVAIACSSRRAACGGGDSSERSAHAAARRRSRSSPTPVCADARRAPARGVRRDRAQRQRRRRDAARARRDGARQDRSGRHRRRSLPDRRDAGRRARGRACRGVDGVDLVLEIEDATGTVLAQSDRGGARVRGGRARTSASTPGRYTAVVRGKKPPRRRSRKPKGKKRRTGAEPAGRAPVYEITAQLVAPAGRRRARARRRSRHRERSDRRRHRDRLRRLDRRRRRVEAVGRGAVARRTRSTSSCRRSKASRSRSRSPTASASRARDPQGAARRAALVVRGLVPVVPAGAPPFHYLTVTRRSLATPRPRTSCRVTGARSSRPTPRSSPTTRPSTPMRGRRRIARSCTRRGRRATSTASRSRRADAARTLDVALDAPAESTSRSSCSSTASRVGKGDHGHAAAKVPREMRVRSSACRRTGARGWQRTTLQIEGAYGIARPGQAVGASRRPWRSAAAIGDPRRPRAHQPRRVRGAQRAVRGVSRRCARASRRRRRARPAARRCSCCRTRSRRCRSAGPAIASTAAA